MPCSSHSITHLFSSSAHTTTEYRPHRGHGASTQRATSTPLISIVRVCRTVFVAIVSRLPILVSCYCARHTSSMFSRGPPPPLLRTPGHRFAHAPRPLSGIRYRSSPVAFLSPPGLGVSSIVHSIIGAEPCQVEPRNISENLFGPRNPVLIRPFPPTYISAPTAIGFTRFRYRFPANRSPLGQAAGSRCALATSCGLGAFRVPSPPCRRVPRPVASRRNRDRERVAIPALPQGSCGPSSTGFSLRPSHQSATTNLRSTTGGRRTVECASGTCDQPPYIVVRGRAYGVGIGRGRVE